MLSRLSRGPEAAAQVISTVADTIRIDAQYASLPVRHYIVGKIWDWGDTKEYSFIESAETLENAVKGAELLYNQEK